MSPIVLKEQGKHVTTLKLALNDCVNGNALDSKQWNLQVLLLTKHLFQHLNKFRGILVYIAYQLCIWINKPFATVCTYRRRNKGQLHPYVPPQRIPPSLQPWSESEAAGIR